MSGLGHVDTWYVSFVELVSGDAPLPLWRHLCRPLFRHCFALGYCPVARQWVVVDPLSHGLLVMLPSFREVDAIVAGIRLSRGRSLAMKVGDCGRRRRRGPFYCVQVMKYLLGMQSSAITPYQLYRAMLRRGAKPWGG